MSEQISRLAVQQLRNVMFPLLPQFIQSQFPTSSDPLVAGDMPVPNIFVGDITEKGAQAATPAITVSCEGEAEGTVSVYRHLLLHVDIWVGGNVASSGSGRRFVSTIYQHIFDSLQNVNWSGRGGVQGIDYVQILRCYETQRSGIMFEPTSKIYHLANTYRVEALCKTWY
jgi:hypothetical protein